MLFNLEEEVGLSYRDYQKETFLKIRAALDRGIRKMLIVKATGLGKTVDMAGIPRYFYEESRGGILILVHRDELVYQTVDKIQRFNPKLKIGIEKAAYRASIDCDVVVASVQTLGRRNSAGKANARLMRFVRKFRIIIVDETHHVKRKSQYEVVLNELGVGPTPSDISKTVTHDRFLLGFTATPKRGDGLGLGLFYQEVVVDYSLQYGVENGWLVKPLVFPEKTNIDISEVTSTAGDFNQKELSKAINISYRNNLIVDAYKRMVAGKLEGQFAPAEGHSIAFCATIKHAHDLARAFLENGIPAASVDKDTPRELRSKIVEFFKKGEIRVLCNCGVFTEGFDASICDSVLMAKPTTSDSLYVQMVGRGTRPDCFVEFDTIIERTNAIANSKKKFLTVIDFVDNHKKNALVSHTTLIGTRDDKILLDPAPRKKEEEEQEEMIFEEEEVTRERQSAPRPKSTAARNEDAESLVPDGSIQSLSNFDWQEVSTDTGTLELSIPDYENPVSIRIINSPEGYKMQRIDRRARLVQEGSSAVPTLAEAVRKVDKWLVEKTNPSQRAMMVRDSPWRKKKTYATANQLAYISRELGFEVGNKAKLRFSEAASIISKLESNKTTELINSITNDSPKS